MRRRQADYDPYVSYGMAPVGRRATVYAYKGMLFKTYRIVIEGPEGTVVDTTGSYDVIEVNGGFQLEYDVYTGSTSGYGFGGATSWGDSPDYSTSMFMGGSSSVHRSIFVDELVEMPMTKEKPKHRGRFR